MGSRESARRDWRANLARAAEAYRRDRIVHEGEVIVSHDLYLALRAARRKPKPWARPRPGADLGKWSIAIRWAKWMHARHPECAVEAQRQPSIASAALCARARLRRKRRAAQRRRR